MAYKGRHPGRQTGQVPDEMNGEKPLAATLMAEFQNLKDKFKNEDDEYDRGKFCQ